MTGPAAADRRAEDRWEPVAVVTGTWGAVVVTAESVRRLDGDAASVAAQLARLDAQLSPRWVWWSARSAVASLVAAAPTLRLRRCWDLAAAHRLLAGGHRDDPGQVWARAQGQQLPAEPHQAPPPRHGPPGQLDLLAERAGDVDDRGAAPARAADDDPLGPDGRLRPGWLPHSPQRAVAWSRLALRVHLRQRDELRAATGGGSAEHCAMAESAAELLCVELEVTGLPVDRDAAEQLIASVAGRRPVDAADADALRAERDAVVLATLPTTVPGGGPGAGWVDLRSVPQVKALLARTGFDLPDTRSWRLEQLTGGSHPLVDALLSWRRAERMSTTYGYRWLDEHLGQDGRLRGAWSGSDGGAGRMTAQGGLHSMPRELRPAVRAEPGHLLVRADLGQVEPRVLAAVSGDPALARAAREDDLYATVAAQLRIERPVAKVAFLAAMYGQTSGSAGEALRDMQRAYPVAMTYLERAALDGARGEDVRTWGGRRVRTAPVDAPGAPPFDAPEEPTTRAHRAALAARGRFARNAVVQGSAAELFKAWTATVRARLAATGRPDEPAGAVVLCLHDELLLHVRADAAEEVARGMVSDLHATAARWSPSGVRFVADVRVVQRWSDATD